jgi:hypothetical protein
MESYIQLRNSIANSDDKLKNIKLLAKHSLIVVRNHSLTILIINIQMVNEVGVELL